MRGSKSTGDGIEEMGLPEDGTDHLLLSDTSRRRWREKRLGFDGDGFLLCNPSKDSSSSCFFSFSWICCFYRAPSSFRKFDQSADHLRPVGVDVISECFFSRSCSL
ncbi:hypothetical protein ACLOJK_007791 [Asimina triloba]